ncbi:MAG: tRNA (guanosine(37)-N1)-methyltransferase TrmD [Erysipelotrichaceae bacterium]|nr:tRNA (guanosine(37)-N1)-methyltransferase TrmD [Solobacterium sp.]MDO4192001.1 tRNA (guanosine(37)-N1)-methyltransferase TrmD [Erysipelotrichaceae bacterium]MDO5120696.1 tRNA (guanosine(37)-N1)-methyltransferase TrmD [Erysipelotrichaceae bacterium]
MKITVLTIFPDMFHDFLNTSIISRSIQKGLVEFEIVDIREYAPGSYRHVDDSPFGGGAGMVMKCQPVLDALDAVRTENSWSVLMSPAGQVYTQAKAHEYSEKDHLILLCGHYEGLDERINHHMDELISIGDYVLTGGELASMVISDSVVRLLKGAIRDESTDEESHENGLLEYPQYTKPADYKGEKVPEILLSGHHENIRKWRLKQSLKLTRERRPDLFAKHVLTKEEEKLLKELDEEENNDSEC